MNLRPLNPLALTVVVACSAGVTSPGAGGAASVPSPIAPVEQAPNREAGSTEDPISEGPSDAPLEGAPMVIFGADTVVVELANTAQLRQRGLMHREEVPDGTGMLFVWGGAAVRSFWMDNTLVALDVAFMDANRRIVDIQQMEPETTNSHTSAEPAQYALEVRAGWFREHGIEVGDVAEFVLDD